MSNAVVRFGIQTLSSAFHEVAQTTSSFGKYVEYFLAGTFTSLIEACSLCSLARAYKFVVDMSWLCRVCVAVERSSDVISLLT